MEAGDRKGVWATRLGLNRLYMHRKVGGVHINFNMAVGSRQIDLEQLFALMVASEHALWTKNRENATLAGFGDTVLEESAPLDELML